MLGYDGRRHLIPFRSQLLPHIFTDVLVIGGGVAGMAAALAAAEEGDVILLAKAGLDLSNTAWAKGGVAAALAEGDTPAAHLADTLEAGAGLCDEPAVRTLVEEGPAAVADLIAHGLRVDRRPDGSIHFGREGGHHAARILHTDGASTGREFVRCLAARVRVSPAIRVFEQCFAIDLLTHPMGDERGEGPVLGAITWHARYGLQVIWARSTILGSGGAGQVYRETTNPRTATGDGTAMAFRAGARIADLEFIQFHPTTLYVAGAGRLLISEAVRGAGAHLVTGDGQRFMPAYHEMAELAPRDVVSRAIMDQIARTQESSVFLDARHLGSAFGERFPDLVEELAAFDLDPARTPIPVHPSAHYTIGGVWTDLEGRSSVPGLLACGEAACNGLHGANRLASNSLLEGLVYGARAGRAASRDRNGPAAPVRINSEVTETEHAELDLVDVRSSLRSALWRNAGIDRTGRRLEGALDMFRFWGRYTMEAIFDEPDGWEVQNMLTVGALLVRAALWRTESRGVHARSDCPESRDEMLVHAAWRRGDEAPTLHPVIAPAEAPA